MAPGVWSVETILSKLLHVHRRLPIVRMRSVTHIPPTRNLNALLQSCVQNHSRCARFSLEVIVPSYLVGWNFRSRTESLHETSMYERRMCKYRRCMGERLSTRTRIKITVTAGTQNNSSKLQGEG